MKFSEIKNIIKLCMLMPVRGTGISSCVCSVCVAVVPAIFKFHLDKSPRALRQRADCLGQSITAGSCLALWDSSPPGGWVGKTQQVLAAGTAAELSTWLLFAPGTVGLARVSNSSLWRRA